MMSQYNSVMSVTDVIFFKITKAKQNTNEWYDNMFNWLGININWFFKDTLK